MENELCELVLPENVFKYIQLSVKNGLEILLERCVECILGNAEAVINGKGFIDLSIDQLESILLALADRDDPPLKEVFNHVLVKWAGADYGNRGSKLPSLIGMLNQSKPKKESSESDSDSGFDMKSKPKLRSDLPSTSKSNQLVQRSKHRKDHRNNELMIPNNNNEFHIGQILQMQNRQMEMQRADARENVKQFTDLVRTTLGIVQDQNKQMWEQGERNMREIVALQINQENTNVTLANQEKLNEYQSKQNIEMIKFKVKSEIELEHQLQVNRKFDDIHERTTKELQAQGTQLERAGMTIVNQEKEIERLKIERKEDEQRRYEERKDEERKKQLSEKQQEEKWNRIKDEMRDKERKDSESRQQLENQILEQKAQIQRQNDEYERITKDLEKHEWSTSNQLQTQKEDFASKLQEERAEKQRLQAEMSRKLDEQKESLRETERRLLEHQAQAQAQTDRLFSAQAKSHNDSLMRAQNEARENAKALAEAQIQAREKGIAEAKAKVEAEASARQREIDAAQALRDAEERGREEAREAARAARRAAEAEAERIRKANECRLM